MTEYHYEMLTQITAGEVVELWLARQQVGGRSTRLVKVKRVCTEALVDGAFSAVLMELAQRARLLIHPGIVRVLDVEVAGGFVVCEVVRGETLLELVERVMAQGQEALPAAVALSLMAQAAEALHFAHQLQSSRGTPLGVVHGALSPSNLRVGFDGRVRLDGFDGVSVDLPPHASSMVLGPQRYMAPEQVLGEGIGTASDVYALGAVLWEALTGRLLFAGKHDFDLLDAICAEAVASPTQINKQVPPLASAVVLKAMAKDPRQRFADAGEMVAALEKTLQRMGATMSQAALADFLRRYYRGRIMNWKAFDEAEAKDDQREIMRLVPVLFGPDLGAEPSGEDQTVRFGVGDLPRESTFAAQTERVLPTMVPGRGPTGGPSASFDDATAAAPSVPASVPLPGVSSGAAFGSGSHSPFEEEDEALDTLRVDAGARARVLRDLQQQKTVSHDLIVDDGEMSEDMPTTEFALNAEMRLSPALSFDEDVVLAALGARETPPAASRDTAATVETLSEMVPREVELGVAAALGLERSAPPPAGQSAPPPTGSGVARPAVASGDDDDEAEDEGPRFALAQLFSQTAPSSAAKTMVLAKRPVLEVLRTSGEAVLGIHILRSRALKGIAGTAIKGGMQRDAGVLALTAGVQGEVVRAGAEAQRERLEGPMELRLRVGDEALLQWRQIAYRARVIHPPRRLGGALWAGLSMAALGTAAKVYLSAVVVALGMHAGALYGFERLSAQMQLVVKAEAPPEIFAEGTLQKEVEVKKAEVKAEPPKPKEPPKRPVEKKPRRVDPAEQQVKIPQAARAKLDEKLTQRRVERGGGGERKAASADDVVKALTSPVQGAGTTMKDIVTNIDSPNTSTSSAVFRTGGTLAALPEGEVNVGLGGGGELGPLGGDSASVKAVSKLEERAEKGKGGGKKVRGSVSGMSGAAKVEGSLSRGEIQAEINKHLGKIQGCYEKALIKSPGLAGRITFEWSIKLDGSVSGAREVNSTVSDATVSSCVLAIIRKMRFPKPTGGEVQIRYPFMFQAN